MSTTSLLIIMRVLLPERYVQCMQVGKVNCIQAKEVDSDKECDLV